MNEVELESFRQKLHSLKKELQALAETTDAAGKPVELDQSRVGRLSRMDAMQNQQMAQAATRRRQQQLLMIDGALRRIDAKDYGYCTVCGDEIDVRRLEFDPTSARCIRCAE